jgi:hypothetical protein
MAAMSMSPRTIAALCRALPRHSLADGLIAGSAEPQKPSLEVIQTHVRLFLAAIT